MNDADLDDARGLARAGVVVAADDPVPHPTAHRLITSAFDVSVAFVFTIVAAFAPLKQRCDRVAADAAVCNDVVGWVYVLLHAAVGLVVLVGALASVASPELAARRVAYRLPAAVLFVATATAGAVL